MNSESWARGFKLSVAGKPQPFRTVVKGLVCDKGSEHACRDVTPVLKQAGLTDEQIALFPYESPFKVRVKPLDEKQQATLEAANLMKEDPNDSVTNFHPGRPYPRWVASVTYAWEMTFPAGQLLKVSHEYVPFARSGSSASYVTEDILREEYCADESLFAALRRLSADHLDEIGDRSRKEFGDAYPEAVVVGGTAVEYVLTTANTWKGPIHDFTLRLKKSHRRELVTLCFPGTFKKFDATTLEVKLKDFSPKDNLRVRFLNISGDKNWDGEPPQFSR